MLQSPNCSRVCGLSDLNKTYLWKKFELKKNEEVYPVFFCVGLLGPIEGIHSHCGAGESYLCLQKGTRSHMGFIFLESDLNVLKA